MLTHPAPTPRRPAQFCIERRPDFFQIPEVMNHDPVTAMGANPLARRRKLATSEFEMEEKSDTAVSEDAPEWFHVMYV